MIPDQMTAITIDGGKGPAEALKPARTATPRPGAGEVLVKVAAAGVNRPDVVQRLGLYPPPPGAPETLGLEIAGEVVAVGDGGGRWREGDKVCALVAGGGYAEYAVVDHRHALPVPKGLSLEEAAAIPETYFTVFSNVFEIGQLKAGETLMVHGANSGIGLTAVALAKAAGAKVIATARSADKLGQAQALGADRLVDVSREDFAEAAKAEGGVDVILEMVGGSYIDKGLVALKPFGRMVIVAVQEAARAEADFRQILAKRLTVTGSTLRGRPADEKARLAAEVEKRVWPWIGAGKARPILTARFPLADAAKAHAWMEANHVGKAVLIA